MSDQRKPGERPALGLSIGATTLAAVTADRSITRRPEIDAYGQLVTDFVERVGDPVGIVAADGSVHRAETLLAESLKSLAYAATDGRPLPPTAISHPAHWGAPAVDMLRRALRRIPEWSVDEPLLIPDGACAITALREAPGMPSAGVVVLCDFGGSGTTITLMSADNKVIGGPVRHLDFSGDLVDRAVLAFVLGGLSCNSWPGLSGTLAFGPLVRLRAECRAAKERLSADAVVSLSARETRVRGGIRVTRAEFDEVIREMLIDLVEIVRGTMIRADVKPTDLAAVATFGGGASIPAITTTLSEHLRAPVVTTARPALTAAIGAALRAPVPLVPIPPVRSALPEAPRASLRFARPMIAFEPEPAELAEPAESHLPWYRRPMPVVAATLLVIVGSGLATVVGLRSNSIAPPSAPEPPPMVMAIPVAQDPVAELPPAPPPPVTQTQVVEAPPVTQTQMVDATVPPQLPQLPPLPSIPTAIPIPPIPGLSLFLPTPPASG